MGLVEKLLLSILAIILPPAAALIIVYFFQIKGLKKLLYIYLGWLYDTFLD